MHKMPGMHLILQSKYYIKIINTIQRNIGLTLNDEIILTASTCHTTSL